MATPEFPTDAWRNFKEDLKTVRERLGKPAFPDQKSAYKMAVRSIAGTVDDAFLDKGVLIQANMIDMVDACKKEGVTITPATITIQTCFSLAREVQRRVLLSLVSQERGQSAKVAALLDVIKGFQSVMSVLNLAYNPIAQEKMMDYPAIKSALEFRPDPKGFSFAKQQEKFWRNRKRMSDGLIEPYEDPRLVADGAELAAKTYERMYPIAERALSAGS